MKRISLQDEIPTFELFTLVKDDGMAVQIVFDWEKEQTKPTWHQLFRQANIYPYSLTYKGVVRVIAETYLTGKVYILNNYKRGELYEYGSTEGIA